MARMKRAMTRLVGMARLAGKKRVQQPEPQTQYGRALFERARIVESET
jgi:hypothetical protein